jgi:hypothetical protein
MIFTNRYFVAVGIPLLLILLGAIARKLIRATPWLRDDFFLGVDLAIAAISSGLIYTSDLLAAKQAASGCSTDACRSVLATADERLVRNSSFLVIALILFLLILAMHQDDGRLTGNLRRQTLVLGVASNLIGVGLLALFILAVKGVGP